ncbi:IucA/IucC family protein [Ectobacillus funiculus]|uniref:IucA/IucC family protein n=1 Tax=Ectobacillus funiculus TaxID=137993 RepID=UPI00101E198D|nr:IucA/IucC family protein [Ectobacillus funiculus]
MIQELTLTREEQDVVSMLEEQAPYLLPYYANSVPEARTATLQRFVMSLMREDIDGIYSTSYDLHNVSPQKPVPLLEDGSYKVYTLESGELLFIPIRQMYAFQRMEGGEAVFHLKAEELYTYTSVSELIHLFQANSSWGALLLELEDSSANLALSLAYWKYRKYVSEIEDETTIQYALYQKQQSRSFHAELLFEQFSVLGHNLHPCAKTRMGMDACEVMRYAPEFENSIPLRFLAIHREWIEQRIVKGRELFTVFLGLERAMEKELGYRNLSLSDYVPVPVHPWQLQHVIPVVYQDELENGVIVILKDYEVNSFALSSFRTVQAESLVVKAALRAQMTSTIRSISPQTANNAAVFTELLQAVMGREQQLSQHFVPVYEWGGGSFRSQDEQKKRNLSFVLREQVTVEEQELAITGTALYSESLVSDQPILLELIYQYKQKLGSKSLEQAAFQWFSEYASLALEGFVTLMVKYGIGLEGHLQNSIPVFRDGCIVRMLFRDWGGARIYKPRLEQAALSVDFYQDSAILTSSLIEMQNKVFYTVIQNHLGEIVYLLSKHMNLLEEVCWAEVRRICEYLFQGLAGEYSAAARQDRDAFFAQTVDYKALLTMRLKEGEKSYSYVKVDNPLYKGDI